MNKIMKFFRENFIVFIIYSIIGWIYEVLYFIIVHNKFINRGFLNGPYLPVYGFGTLLLWHILKDFIKKQHKFMKLDITPILVFVIIFIVATIVEYISHYILDNYFNIVLWDYHKNFMNIDGRVCLDASRNFALGGTAALYLIQPFIEKLFKIKNKTVLNVIIIILLMIILIDFIYTLIS